MPSVLVRSLVLVLALGLMTACQTGSQDPGPDRGAATAEETEDATAEPTEEPAEETEAATPEETEAAKPDEAEASDGSVVFSDDFSDPETGWFGGDASFEDTFDNGSLEGEYSEDETLLLTAQVEPGYHTVLGEVVSADVMVDGEPLGLFGDVRLEADVTIIERREAATAALACRQDTEEGTFYTGYILMEPGFPVDVRIARSDSWEGDVTQLDVSEPLLEDIEDATGTTFHLAMECAGDTITLSVDGEVVAEATDDAYAEGGVGFEYVSFISEGVAEAGAEPRLVLEYDNFELEGTPAEE